MGCLPHLVSDGLDLTVYSIHRVIMACSLLQEFLSLVIILVGQIRFAHFQYVTPSIHFPIEGEPAVIEDQSWFPFLSGNGLHD